MNAFFQKYHRYLVLAVLTLLLQSLCFCAKKDQIFTRCLSFDYDGYWHLLRVQEIQRTGSWDNEINPRGNAPFGERIHWTHAMDLVLWTGANIGSLFVDFDSSLYWWGVFVGPAFYVLSAFAVVLFARAVVGPKYVMHWALLFLCSPAQLLALYSVNRPDHHCLVAFALVLYYCLFMVLLKGPTSTSVAVLTGLVGAFGLWCGLELLVLVGASVLYLALLWLVRGEKYLKANYLLCLALSVGLMMTVILDEKPGHWWASAYDKRSLVHVSLFFFLFLFWLGEIVLTRTGFGKTIGTRLATAVGGAIFVLLPCLILFPGLIDGPMAKVDPRLYTLYLTKTSEFSTMDAASHLPEVGYYVLLVVPGFIYVALTAYRRREKRVLFSWLAVTVCLYSILALATTRWIFTLIFAGILPTTLLLIGLWNWSGAKRHPVVAVVATLILLSAPYAALVALPSSPQIGGKTSQDYDSKLVEMLSFMECQDYAAAGQIVLANIYIGPAIMYCTSLDAVGTPNHNNARGIIDTYRILNAEDDAAAHGLIQARGADYLLVDKPMKKFAAIRIDPSCDPNEPPEATFIGRLDLGRIPDWLVKMPVPEKLADTFTLYRVTAGGRGTDG